MLFCGSARFESAEIPAFSGLGIFLARGQPVLAGLKFSDHGDSFPPYGVCLLHQRS